MTPAPAPTLAEQLKKAHESLSPAERRVARVVLADYPVAGLEPVHRLAERANVSAPTVLRLLLKLEIGSYPQMQKLLREEISARSTSPLLMYQEREESSRAAQRSGLSFVAAYRRMLNDSIDSAFDSLQESELLEIVKLLANPRYRIWTVGGRFSDTLAQYLAFHLQLLRKEAGHVGNSEHDKTFALMDFGPKDVLVAFDYRRYQDSTVDLLNSAKRRKATTILFTDPWLSPAAKFADHVFSSPVASTSPFDSLAPAFALVETIIAGVVDELGDEPTQRIASFDELQERTLHASGRPTESTPPPSTRRTS